MDFALYLWSGFLIGILGSFHCVGMCGPIVMAVPHLSENKLTSFFDGVLYNFGRAITYAIMGALLGIVGTSIRLAGFQEKMSIAAGVLMLLFLFLPKDFTQFASSNRFIYKITNSFRKYFRMMLEKKSRLALLGIGILNGLLPCGLVYIALAGSLAVAGSLEGALYMALFGIGTIPMLAVVYVAKNFMSLDLRRKINKFIPAGVAVVAILMILRGLALGIPYISPVLPDSFGEDTPSCCH